jgi:hypothetical protein
VEIGVDASTASHVGEVVGIGQGEAFQDSELRFDQVSQEASVGVQTGRMWSRRSKARKRG